MRILKASLLLFIFSIPIENSFQILKGVSLSNFAGTILASVSIVCILQNKLSIKRIPKIFYYYLLPIILSAFVAFDILLSVRGLITYVLLLVMVYLVYSIVVNNKILIQVLFVFTLSSFFCIVGIFINYQEIRLTHWWEPRTSSYGADSNTLAVILSIGNVFIFMLHKYFNHKIYSLYLIIYSLLFPIAIILTGSRTGAIVGMLSFIPAVYHIKSRLPLLIASLTIICVCLSYTSLSDYLPQANINRIIETNDNIKSGQYSSREIYWARAIRLIQENPILGMGVNNFAGDTDKKLGTSGAVTHNTYLSIWVETGTIGLAMFIYLLWILFNSVHKHWGNDKIFGYGILLIICTAMLTLTLEYYKIVWFIYILILTYSRNSFSKTNYYRINNMNYGS